MISAKWGQKPLLRISARSFALRQEAGRWLPWLIMLIIAGLAFYGLFRYFLAPASTLNKVVSFLLILLIGGGSVLGYAIWNISQLRAGLISKPKRPWQLTIDAGRVTIEAGKYTTEIPVGGIESVCLVVDDSWEQLRGMESACLVLHLERGGRIAIPRSASGFTELLALVRASHAVKGVSV